MLCRSKQVRPSLIFRTQTQIFLIQSESFKIREASKHVSKSDTEEKKLLNKVFILVFFVHKHFFLKLHNKVERTTE